MKIVITGDTHMPGRGKKLPDRLLKECSDAQLILHTGDWSSPEILNTLSSYAEVKGVYGNVDGNDMQALVPERQLINSGGIRIGLIHGHGEKKTTEQRAIEAFQAEKPDVIVFGHSHIPVIKYFNGCLLLNPGSPTDKRKLPYYSFILLHIAEDIRPELILFKNKS